MAKALVIGSGFAGISAATHLAQKGYEVKVLEKNEGPGGRCSVWSKDGFTFDMGPSWYWMPDVFERYFAQFGKRVSDYYTLDRLDPGYRVFFPENLTVDIPGNDKELFELFDRLEDNGGEKLKIFLNNAKAKYEAGMNDLVHRPSISFTEFIDFSIVKQLPKLKLFTSLTAEINSLFTSEAARKLLEFPAYFLGALPKDTPALYSLMNYADLSLGTWYPQGGMHQIIKAMVSLAEELGVSFEYNAEVEEILVNSKGQAYGLSVNNITYDADLIVAGADYHHVESQLLDPAWRNYRKGFWDKQVMAPSSLIYYLGIDKPLDNMLHHNLFFDEDIEQFGSDIYSKPQWPERPLFYVCCPSKTDESVAPKGKENLFLLMPLAPDLEDTESLREERFTFMIEKLETITGKSIHDAISVKRGFCINDFKSRYHAYRGNAYGLANTLRQTAIFKPKMINKKVNNLFYTGQLTVPGPGVPPSLISGEVVANYISRKIPLTQKQSYDALA